MVSKEAIKHRECHQRFERLYALFLPVYDIIGTSQLTEANILCPNIYVCHAISCNAIKKKTPAHDNPIMLQVNPVWRRADKSNLETLNIHIQPSQFASAPLFIAALCAFWLSLKRRRGNEEENGRWTRVKKKNRQSW